MSHSPSPRPRPSSSIEAIIPVHDVRRPIDRTIRSLLRQEKDLIDAGASLTISVVCHNLSTRLVEENHRCGVTSPAVRLISFNDQTVSPAGPKNYALSKSAADFVTFIDSDDYLEPGSLVSWYRTAVAHNADVVIAPIRTPGGEILATPYIRPSRPKYLDPVLDGLASRSLPFGLLRRKCLSDLDFAYTEGLRVGEDLEPTLRLFFRADRVVYPYDSPPYHQTDDAIDRVTSAVVAIERELEWLPGLVEQQWLKQAPASHRQAIAFKLLRVQGIGGLRRRAQLAESALAGKLTSSSLLDAIWNDRSPAGWRRFYSALRDLANGRLGALSQRDARFAQAATSAISPTELVAAFKGYTESGVLGELLPQDLRYVLDRNSVARHYVQVKMRDRAQVYSHPDAFSSAYQTEEV